jgi:hypothetical protein
MLKMFRQLQILFFRETPISNSPLERLVDFSGPTQIMKTGWRSLWRTEGAVLVALSVLPVAERACFKSVSQIPRYTEAVKILAIECIGLHHTRQICKLERKINNVEE